MTATMYFDVRDLERPENADFTYTGRLSYSAYSVDFCLKNVNAPFDIVTLNFDDREELVRILKLTQNEFVTLKATNFFTVG